MAEKSKKSKPKLILCADLHFRDDQPSCRTDGFFKTQIKKMRWLNELQSKYDCPVLCSGDYFYRWKPAPRIISACIENMPFVTTIPGNHDLPNHNLQLLEKSGLATMEKAGKVYILHTELGDLAKAFFIPTDKGIHVGAIHKLINHPQANTNARSILKKYKKYELIVSGDNHQTFTEHTKTNRWLVNPGSFTRQTTEQAAHRPSVFLWYTEGFLRQIFIPIEQGVISSAHLEKTHEHNKRMETFISKLADDYDVKLDFKENVKLYFENNETSDTIKQLVMNSLGGVSDER